MSPVTIGRSKCTLNIEASFLSKKQCQINYDSGRWYIRDGFEGKDSTNGTW